MGPKKQQREADVPNRRMTTLLRRPDNVVTDDGKPVGTTGDLKSQMPNAYRGKLDDKAPGINKNKGDVRASAAGDDLTHLDGLEGEAYQSAVAALTPEQRTRYEDQA